MSSLRRDDAAAVTATPEPLAAERDVELRYVREQALFYNAMLRGGNDPRYTLIPCCSRCASSDLFDDYMRLAFVCLKCGNVDSADVVRAGRIAKR